MILNRSELISNLSLKFKSFTSADIDYSVKKILEFISQSLYSGDRIEIRGFGTFSIRQRKTRMARNPKTGTSIKVNSKFHPYFRAAKYLRNKLKD